MGERFWGSESKHNFYARAKNLVISGELNRHMLLQVQKEYGGDIAKDFADQWKKLLEEIVYQISIDGVIDSDERAYFKEYIAIFQIPADEARRIYRTGARRACLQILRNVTKDNRVEDHELKRVENIALGFGLKEFDVTAQLTHMLKGLIQERFNDIASDLMISDYEWEDFQQFCADMKVNFSTTSENDRVIAQARKNWSTKYGRLQPIAVAGVKLSPDEQVYFTGGAKWYEPRKLRGESYQKLISTGDLYMTNDRILMIAYEGDNKSIKWKDIHHVLQVETCAFELEKIKGKSPTVLVTSSDGIGLVMASTIAHRLCRGDLS
tara:strand:+ start:409 stop:1377 length:969 start_codon:yes stop_codon:yes gene_type:complete